MREKSKLFFINGAILTATSLMMRFITLIFNVFISNKIGSEALGVFSLVMSVYLFFITVATSGLSVAATVIVPEKFALQKDKIAIKAIRSCILFSLLLGLNAGLLLILFSNSIVRICLHNMVSTKVLFFIAIGLPFIAMSACITAYFTAIRKAYKNAISQVFEFIIKFIFTILLLNINISKGVEAVCISLILADVISEVCSFTFIFILYKFDIKKKHLNNIHSFAQKTNIIKIAFPVAITSYIRSGLSTLKQLIIPTQLEKSGMSCATALSKYGILNGMVLPVITFPTVLMSSYSMLLIPEISTYLAQKNYKAINFVCNKIFKITSAFSFCVCSIFLFFSSELGLVIYNNLESGYYFKILAPLIFFMYMDNVIDSILKGLNKQFGVMCCNILDLTVTTCFIYFFLPIIGVTGYVISIFISELLNFTVSLFQLIKYAKLKINLIDWIVVPIICCFVAFFILNFAAFSFTNIIVNLILNIVLFIVIYFITFCCLNYFKLKYQKK